MKVIPIQFLAMLTMLIDHIGAVWFPNDLAWRVIGRLALPFYVYAMVVGYFRTRNVKRYTLRVGLLALLSQLPYQLAFHTLELNVIATLLICLLTLLALDHYKGRMAIQLAFTGASTLLLEAIPFDYGAYALLLALIYRYATPHMSIALHLALNVLSVVYKGWYLQLFSLFSTMWLVYLPDFLRSMDKIRIPRFIWRSFYPLHLAIIAWIRYMSN